MAQTTSDLATFWDDLHTHILTLVGTSGEESTLTIAAVAEGEAVPEQFQIPFIVMQLIDFKVQDRTGTNKVWTGRVKFRVVTLQTSALRPTVEIMDKIAQVQDKLDTFTRPDGTRGLEDAEWSITYPLTPEHGNLIIAEQVASFNVNVARGDN